MSEILWLQIEGVQLAAAVEKDAIALVARTMNIETSRLCAVDEGLAHHPFLRSGTRYFTVYLRPEAQS